MYSVIYIFRLRLWYESTEICMVLAEPPLPSPAVYDSKLGDFYTDSAVDQIGPLRSETRRRSVSRFRANVTGYRQ